MTLKLINRAEVSLKHKAAERGFPPEKRTPHGVFTVAELLGQIDKDEIAVLNSDVKEFTLDDPAGKEYW